MTEGTKYHPLFEHLLFSGQGQITMSFSEIESIIGASLPPSARKREEWWSNSPSGHSQARAWMRASYRTSEVDLRNERVSFKLKDWPEGYVRPSISDRFAEGREEGFGETTQSAFEGPEPAKATEDHPLFGIWTGNAKLLPGYDYTRPAFEPESTP